MIGGRKAFHGESQAELIAAILEHEPAQLSEEMASSVPGLDRLVSKCLRKDPDARWQTSTDLLDELRWIVSERRMAGAAVVPRSVPLKWLGLAAAVLLVAIAVGVASLPRTQS